MRRMDRNKRFSVMKGCGNYSGGERRQHLGKSQAGWLEDGTRQ